MNKVHNTDCLEFMKQQKDKAFDFCVADPWYGIGMMKNDTTGFADRRFRNPEKYQMQKGLEIPE